MWSYLKYHHNEPQSPRIQEEQVKRHHHQFQEAYTNALWVLLSCRINGDLFCKKAPHALVAVVLMKHPPV
jgi:hypothetical protein